MATRVLPTPEVLRQLLRYEPETGKLFWLERSSEFFGCPRIHRSWNGQHAGKEALANDNGAGYPCGRIFDRPYLAHRVIWAIVTGSWPVDQIDHINNVRDDNRMENLRQATNAQNQFNQEKQSNNTSGFKGVYLDSRRAKWFAAARCNGRNIHLGYFSDAASASVAYEAYAKSAHGVFVRLSGAGSNEKSHPISC